MSKNNHIPPKFREDKFSCPHCNVVTQQSWHPLTQFSYGRKSVTNPEMSRGKDKFSNMQVSICKYCQEPTLWHNENPVYPIAGHQSSPHPDMPENIRLIYEEAASISQLSPRASCALMRHAVEELVKDMGYKDDLFNNIGQMYEEGLIDDIIKDSLDIVRLTGNDALHGNQIDMNDQTNVDYMFELINEIVESLISSPKRRKNMLEKFGQNRLDSIKRRDSQ